MKKLITIFMAMLLSIAILPASTSAQTYTFNNHSELESFFAKYNLSIYDLFGSYQQSKPDQQRAVNQEDTVPTPAPERNVEGPSASEPVEETAPATSLSQFEQQVVNLTNAERKKAGLAPLKVSEELSNVARVKSEDMRDNNYFSHQSPTYGSPFDMMKQFGISYTAAGENIAAGQRSPEEVVQAWMNSEGHRKNILSGNFTHIGVGYASGGSYGHYWTQQFIRK